MVCLPCCLIPVLLYIWHKFLQPIMLRYWNPWAKKDTEGNVIKAAPEFPFECKGGVCTFAKKAKPVEAAAPADSGSKTATDSPAPPTANTVTTGDTKKDI